MAPASPRTRFSGPVTAPTLVHLLARLADLDGAAAPRPFAERLGQWLHWTDAVALAAALDTGAPARSAATARAGSADAHELGALRDTLTDAINDAITEDCAANAASPPTDAGPLRRRCTALQQSMAARISPLRGKLRQALCARSSALASLAALDTVMEDVLGRQEQALLASVPGLLEARFQRLREGQDAAWWPTFCQDLQAVLLAELDLRLQPLEGLAAALCASRPHTSPP